MGLHVSWVGSELLVRLKTIPASTSPVLGLGACVITPHLYSAVD